MITVTTPNGTTIPMARPAAQSGQCDANFTRRLRADGSPVVTQCKDRAVFRIVIDDGTGPRAVKRCFACRAEIYTQPVRVLDEQSI